MGKSPIRKRQRLFRVKQDDEEKGVSKGRRRGSFTRPKTSADALPHRSGCVTQRTNMRVTAKQNRCGRMTRHKWLRVCPPNFN